MKIRRVQQKRLYSTKACCAIKQAAKLQNNLLNIPEIPDGDELHNSLRDREFSCHRDTNEPEKYTEK